MKAQLNRGIKIAMQTNWVYTKIQELSTQYVNKVIFFFRDIIALTNKENH